MVVLISITLYYHVLINLHLIAHYSPIPIIQYLKVPAPSLLHTFYWYHIGYHVHSLAFDYLKDTLLTYN